MVLDFDLGELTELLPMNAMGQFLPLIAKSPVSGVCRSLPPSIQVSVSPFEKKGAQNRYFSGGEVWSFGKTCFDQTIAKALHLHVVFYRHTIQLRR